MSSPETTPLDRERLLGVYRKMKTIREFEERLHLEIQKGQIAGFTHLYSGQEAVAVGVCEALMYAISAGLDCEKLIAAIGKGAARCWALDNLAPRIIQRDYAPGFMVDHFIKDLGIAVSETEIMKLQLPGLELAKSLYEKYI